MDSQYKNQKHIKLVSSFADLVNTKMQGENNAIGWLRNLVGDFDELVSKLNLRENITEINPDDLLSLNLTSDGEKARTLLLSDYYNLLDCGAQPSINLLKCYERDTEFDFIATDVYSFHVDRSPLGTDTFLCTYSGSASDIIANENVIQKIKIPEVREKLKAFYDGPESEFDIFLEENYFDLHYQAHPNSEIINLGNGNLWRLACDSPEHEVLPCVHRAPVEKDGKLRLMLIC